MLLSSRRGAAPKDNVPGVRRKRNLQRDFDRHRDRNANVRESLILANFRPPAEPATVPAAVVA